MRVKRMLFSATLIACALAGPVALAFTVIAHDQVQPIGASASALEKYYQPLLYVTDKGCVPYPAVDVAGDVSGGLAASGSPNGSCTSSVGQIYSRYTTYDNMCAVMYSWFMPKDMPPSGIGGHRYEWEGIIVWLSSCDVGASIIKINYSEHGSWSVSSSPPTWTGTTGYASQGVHPLVVYHAPDFFLDHHPDPTHTIGGTQPLVGWSFLPAPALEAINNFNFSAATPPLRDSTFTGNLSAGNSSTLIHHP